MKDMLLSLILAITICYSTNAEMPEPLNFEELCESSTTIILGEPAQVQTDTKIHCIKKVEYKTLIFNVHKVYKSKGKLKERIKVIVPTGYKEGYEEFDLLIPNYKTGEKYLLFLKKRPFSDLFIRVAIDDIWPERKWNKNYEKVLQEELAFLSDPNRWQKKGDNLSYTIPAESNEVLVELTTYQKRNDYSKRAKYVLNGEIVGERAWYKNNQIAYEEPLKNGIRHGLFKTWDINGNLRQERPYRKNRLHGILKEWGKNGSLAEVSYWIRGNYVTKKKYLKELKRNATLQKLDTDAIFKASND